MTLRQKGVIFLLCAIPPVWLLILLHLYYVPCFHSDEWVDTLPMLAHYLDGTLRFSDLCALVGLHRLFFPHVIALGLGVLTHWNVVYELATELALAGVVVFNLTRIIRQTGGDWRFVPVVFLLIFSPVGYENWMLGYQICFWLTLACLTSIPWMAGLPWKYPGTAALCFVASFSCAAGLVSWAIALPLLWFSAKSNIQAELTKLLAWLAGAGASVMLYFHGWSHRPASSGGSHLLAHPLDTGLFFLSYFGNPYSRGFSIGQAGMERIIGTVLFGIFVAGAVVAWRRNLIAECLPWLALGLGVILISAETTYGRFGAAVQQSRYVPFAAVFSIAVIFVCLRLKLFKALPAVIIPLSLMSALGCNPDWEQQQRLFKLSLVREELIDVLDQTNSIQNVTIVSLPSPAETIGQIRTLEKHGVALATRHI